MDERVEPLVLDELLRSRSERLRARPALRGTGQAVLSYQELDGRTARMAAQLADWGVGGRDAVALVLPNGLEMALSMLASMRVGIAAPLNPGFRAAEFGFYLQDLNATAVILPEEGIPECHAAAGRLDIPVIRMRSGPGAEPGSVELVFPARGAGGRVERTDRDSEALVLHTSGTTSRPKMVPLSHANLLTSARNVVSSLALRPDDVCLNVMPLFHIHGIVASLLSTLVAGGSAVCTEGYLAPAFLDWLDGEGATWYTAVPTMHQGILARARLDPQRPRCDALRMIRSSSASLPSSVLEELEATFGVPVIEAYGMTEAAHQITSNPLPPAPRKPGSVGVAAGPEVSIADESGRLRGTGEVGEVVIRGDNVTAGYRGVADSSDHLLSGGWLRTGDQGYLDGDGYLYLTGRLKEIINRGGETIAPREVDEALLRHPDVVQAVAFSVPDERLGEEVAAAVVVVPGSDVSEDSLIGWLESSLSFAKLPKRVVFVEEIPKGPTGKLQRIGLADRLGLSSVPPGRPGGPTPAGLGEEPRADLVARLTALWKSTLGVEEVGLDDDFLDAGGDSVTATQLILRAREEFGVEIPLLAFFSSSTVRAQARVIGGLM